MKRKKKTNWTPSERLKLRAFFETAAVVAEKAGRHELMNTIRVSFGSHEGAFRVLAELGGKITVDIFKDGKAAMESVELTQEKGWDSLTMSAHRYRELKLGLDEKPTLALNPIGLPAPGLPEEEDQGGRE